MKKIIHILSLLLACSLIFSACKKEEKPESTQEVTTAQTTSVTLSEEEKENAKLYAKELFDASSEVADMYSTAGATVIADIITSNDVNSNDSEKINICNKVASRFDKEGIWAFKMERFKIISVVYTPYENADFVARYPDEYTGDVKNVNSKNISDFLE